jgi:hypothetical protein
LNRIKTKKIARERVCLGFHPAEQSCVVRQFAPSIAPAQAIEITAEKIVWALLDEPGVPEHVHFGNIR